MLTAETRERALLMFELRRYNPEQLRNPKGTVGGGRWRKLSHVAAALLKDWLRNDGKGEPLGEKGFSRTQLMTILTDMRKSALARGDGPRAASLTPRRGASEDEMKLMLYKDAHAHRGEHGGDEEEAPPAPKKAPAKRAPAKKAAPSKAGDALTGLSSDELHRIAEAEGIPLPKRGSREQLAQTIRDVRFKRTDKAGAVFGDRLDGLDTGALAELAGDNEIDVSNPSDRAEILRKLRAEKIVAPSKAAPTPRAPAKKATPKAAPTVAAPRRLKEETPRSVSAQERKDFDTRLAAAAKGDAAADAAGLKLYEEDDEGNLTSDTMDALFGRGVQPSLEQYQGEGFQPINTYLRTGTGSAATKAHVRRIDQALASPDAELDRDVEGWRGFDAAPVFGDLTDDSMVGRVYSDPGYTSISTGKRTAEDFAPVRGWDRKSGMKLTGDTRDGRSVVTRILVPKGTGSVLLSPSGAEGELLLPKGASFRVVADHGVKPYKGSTPNVPDGEARYLDVEVYWPEGTSAPAKKATPRKATAKAPDLTGEGGLSSDPAVREVQVENRVKAAYLEALAAGDRGYNGTPASAESFAPGVRLSAVRDRLGESVNRHEVDEALRRLSRQDGVFITSDENQKTLTHADREAAVNIFGDDKNMISIEPGRGRELRPLPRGGPATPTKRAPAKKATPKAAPGKAGLVAKKRDADADDKADREIGLYVSPRSAELNTPYAADRELDRSYTRAAATKALDGLSANELRELAATRGVDLGTAKTRPAMVKQIVEHRRAAQIATNGQWDSNDRPLSDLTGGSSGASTKALQLTLSDLTTRQKRARLKALGFTPEQVDELAPTARTKKARRSVDPDDLEFRDDEEDELDEEDDELDDEELDKDDEVEEPDPVLDPAARARALALLETRALGHDVTPGNDELHHYWTRGKGLAKWRLSPHPWTTLVTLLSEHVPVEKAKVFASKWFHEVFGYWSGDRKGHNPVGPG